MATNHWLWFIVLITWQSNATELTYPVAQCTIDGQSLQFLVHQKSINCIELWIHNEHTGDEYKALSNFYIPAAVRILPNLSGYSFIHNDAVYIKYFNKRSPKRIEFYEPLYGINAIEWLDAKHFYFAAREHKRFRIYESDLEGTVHRLVSNDHTDALYPQKIDAELFYIERDEQQQCRIIKTLYRKHYNREIVLEMDKQIGFLNMISANEGFFLAYPQTVFSNQELVQFSYYQLLKQDKQWLYKWLFDFHVPTAYLVDGPDRVYESVMPFLPRYVDKKLFGITYKNINESEQLCYETN